MAWVGALISFSRSRGRSLEWQPSWLCVSLFVSVCRSSVSSSSVPRPPIPHWCPVRAWLFFTYLPTPRSTEGPHAPSPRAVSRHASSVATRRRRSRTGRRTQKKRPQARGGPSPVALKNPEPRWLKIGGVSLCLLVRMIDENFRLATREPLAPLPASTNPGKKQATVPRIAAAWAQGLCLPPPDDAGCAAKRV